MPRLQVLDGPTLGSIWTGNLTMWNDTRIAALNPNTTLPGQPIQLAYSNDTIASIANLR